MSASVVLSPVQTDNAYSELVIQHLDLVKYVALDVLKRLPVAVELDDLVQAGTLGLLDACRKYDSARKVPFVAYARHRIRGAILDNLRQLAPTSRAMRDKKRKLDEASDQLTATLHRAPTEEEISAQVGMSLQKCRSAIREVRQAWGPMMSLDGSDADGGRPIQCASSEDSRPDMLAMESEKAALLRDALRDLPSRYRRVLVLYYRDGRLMREIGSAMGVRESRVSQIHSAALVKVREALERAGVRSAWEV